MQICKACKGYGFTRSISSIALSVLRKMRSEVSISISKKSNRQEFIKVEIAPEVSDFLLNNKISEISKIESMSNLNVHFSINKNMYPYFFTVQRVDKMSYHYKTKGVHEKGLNKDLDERPKKLKIASK